jgi:hypothetical protein
MFQYEEQEDEYSLFFSLRMDDAMLMTSSERAPRDDRVGAPFAYALPGLLTLCTTVLRILYT